MPSAQYPVRRRVRPRFHCCPRPRENRSRTRHGRRAPSNRAAAPGLTDRAGSRSPTTCPCAMRESSADSTLGRSFRPGPQLAMIQLSYRNGVCRDYQGAKERWYSCFRKLSRDYLKPHPLMAIRLWPGSILQRTLRERTTPFRGIRRLAPDRIRAECLPPQCSAASWAA